MKYEKVLMNGRTYTRQEKAAENFKSIIICVICLFALFAEWWIVCKE